MLRRVLGVPLRLRVTLLYVLLGLVMSLLFAWTVRFITEDYENVVVAEILRSQANDYSARLGVEPDAILPRSRRLSGYVRHHDGSGEVPDVLAALAPGVHEFEAQGQQAAVFDTDVGRLYFVIDLQDIEQLEQHMAWILVGVVLLGTLFSAWLGWILSSSVVRPVQRLADAVDQLSTRPARTHLAATLPRDSLGRLGQSIDDYQARLVDSEQAERAFFADASHELRTPIAVVRGATELLIEDGQDLPNLQPRLKRLDRGVRQLSELLDALLGLARHKVGSIEAVDQIDWLTACLHPTDAMRDGVVQLEVRGDNVRRALPLHEGALVLSGMARQLVPTGSVGTLQATILGDVLTLQLLDESGQAVVDDAAPAASSDRGFAMTLIGRLASHIGWMVDEDLAHRRIQIQLPPQPDDQTGKPPVTATA